MSTVKRVKEAGKSLDSYYRLRDRGLSEEEAFEQAKPSKSITTINIDEIEYTIPQAMKKLNSTVDYSTVMKRIKFGMSIIDAITRPNQIYK
jgi:hypothetical protein